MSYKEYRYSLAIGDFVDDIYVEVRNWKNIVAFIDAHDKNYPKPSLELRMPLLKRFSVIASSYYIEYKSIVSNELIPNHPEPLTEIVAYNTKGEKRFFNCNKLKEFIEGLGDSKLSLNLPDPPKYPQQMSSYSVWHYKLDYNCFCRDVDYTEFRNGRISAFIETTGKLDSKQHLVKSIPPIKKRLKLQIRIMEILSLEFNVPSFIVIHLTDLSYFQVYDLDWNIILQANQDEYTNWLSNL